MSQVTSPIVLDSTGQDIVTQLATISAALAAGNVVTGNTDTTLSGVLQGANGKVAVIPVDSIPTADSTNLVSSGGTDKAIKGRVPVFGMGKNLLDNAYFLNPVNQRGVTSGAAGYSIDRWLASFGSGGVSWTLTSSGLTFQPTNASSYGYICQVIGSEILSALTGKNISVYVLTSAGDVIGGVATYTSDVSIYDANYGGHRVRIRFVGSEIRIESYASALTVCAVKLELGSEQTLCHNEGTAEAPVWVLNEVPDYEYELYRCMTSTADSSDTYANKTLAVTPASELIGTGHRLIRCGKLRILSISGFYVGASVITIPVADRPASTTSGLATYNDNNSAHMTAGLVTINTDGSIAYQSWQDYNNASIADISNRWVVCPCIIWMTA